MSAPMSILFFRRPTWFDRLANRKAKLLCALVVRGAGMEFVIEAGARRGLLVGNERSTWRRAGVRSTIEFLLPALPRPFDLRVYEQAPKFEGAVEGRMAWSFLAWMKAGGRARVSEARLQRSTAEDVLTACVAARFATIDPHGEWSPQQRRGTMTP